MSQLDSFEVVLVKGDWSLVEIGSQSQHIKDSFQTEPIFLPPGWGTDGLSRYLGMAQVNTRLAAKHYPEWYSLLSQINRTLEFFHRRLEQNNATAAGIMSLRSHASFMSAVGMALSGQLPESSAVLRQCLESSLYAFQMNQVSEASTAWLERHKGDAERTRSRQMFTLGSPKSRDNTTILRRLADLDSRLADIASKLYDAMIDLGGHPNQQAVTRHMKIPTDESGNISWSLSYLSTERLTAILAFKHAAEIGMCIMKVLEYTFPENYKRLGIKDKVEFIVRDYCKIIDSLENQIESKDE